MLWKSRNRSVEGQVNWIPIETMIEESNPCDQQSPTGTSVDSTEQNGTLDDEVKNTPNQSQRHVMKSRNRSVEGRVNWIPIEAMIEEGNSCDQKTPSGTNVDSIGQNGTLDDEVKNTPNQSQRHVMKSRNRSVEGQVNWIPIEAMTEESNPCDQKTPSGTNMNSTKLNDSLGVELASNMKHRKDRVMEYRNCEESCKELKDFEGSEQSTEIDLEHIVTSLNGTPNTRSSTSGPTTEPVDFEEVTEFPVLNSQPSGASVNSTQNNNALASGPTTEIADQCDINDVTVHKPSAATEHSHVCVKLKFMLSTYTDLHIFKNMAFLAVAIALLGYGISASVFNYLVILLDEKGFPRSDFVILINAMSITNTLLGPLIGYLVSKPSVRPYVKYLYAAACILNGCLVAVAGSVNSLAAFVVIGLGRTLLIGQINGCLSGVMVDLFGVDQILEYTAGASVFQGVANFIGPYIAGMSIRELF